MLLAIELTLNVFALAGIIVLALFTGFIARSAQLSNSRHSLEKLEKEMLSNHAEILRLQKELADKTAMQSRTPIVPMREPAEPAQEKLPDTSTRKKMLGGGLTANS